MNMRRKGLGLAVMMILMATAAHAGRNLEVIVRHESGNAIAGASVCLGWRQGPVDAVGAARTDTMGVARFENVPVNGALLTVNVTAPGYEGEGATRGLRMMGNLEGTLEPPQAQGVELPGNGAECDVPGDEPEPEPEPDPMTGGGGRTTTPTPTKTFHFRTVDYGGDPVPGATVCAGPGPGETGSLYGRAITDGSGHGSISGIPSGGRGYRRVVLLALKGCQNLSPRQVDGDTVYPCGVGAEFAQPDLASRGRPFLIVVGAADQESADDTAGVANFLCPPVPAGDPTPTRWNIRAQSEIEEDTTANVEARILRGELAWLMGWLYDFEWEVSNPSVLEIVGPARSGRRITVRGKRPGTATLTARLARPDGRLASATQGSTTITVTAAGGIDRERSVAAFEDVQGVFAHPRCTNCHVGGRNPKQGDDRSPHSPDRRNQRPSRGDDCTRCHAARPASTGYDAPHAPGATWAMPPTSMSFEDPAVVGQLKLARDLCNDIKQTYRDRNLCHTDQECALRVADHIDHDGLVIWSFMPGGSRSPASMHGHAHFSGKIREWAERGGFCPE